MTKSTSRKIQTYKWKIFITHFLFAECAVHATKEIQRNPLHWCTLLCSKKSRVKNSFIPAPVCKQIYKNKLDKECVGKRLMEPFPLERNGPRAHNERISTHSATDLSSIKPSVSISPRLKSLGTRARRHAPPKLRHAGDDRRKKGFPQNM